MTARAAGSGPKTGLWAGAAKTWRTGFCSVRDSRLSPGIRACRPGAGEIDIVARDGDSLVFIEVKTRRSDEYGAPDRAIGLDKQCTMLRAARHFARQAEIASEKARFDGVAIVLQTLPVINHYRDMLPVREEVRAL